MRTARASEMSPSTAPVRDEEEHISNGDRGQVTSGPSPHPGARERAGPAAACGGGGVGSAEGAGTRKKNFVSGGSCRQQGHSPALHQSAQGFPRAVFGQVQHAAEMPPRAAAAAEEGAWRALHSGDEHLMSADT